MPLADPDVAAILAAAQHHRIDLTPAAALRRLQRAGRDRDAVVRDLEFEHAARQARAFVAEYRRLVNAYYHADAWARHAAMTEALSGGTLGWKASMLLRAARDAEIHPGADHYRKRLERIVGDEIERRYPDRGNWAVVQFDSAHAERLRAAIRDERYARDLVLSRRPELSQRIDALSSPHLQRAVRHVLNDIRRRVRACAREGWTPDPERYQREVVDAAHAHAARA